MKKLLSLCVMGLLAMPLAAQQDAEAQAKRRADEAAARAAEIQARMQDEAEKAKAAEADARMKAAQAEAARAAVIQKQQAGKAQAAKAQPAEAKPAKEGERKPNAQVIQQARSIKQNIANFQAGGKHKLSDVIQVTRTDGVFAIDVAEALKQPGQNRRIEIEGSPATWVLNCYGTAVRTTRTVALTRYDFDEAERGGFWCTTLNIHASTVNIYAQGGYNDVMEHVQLSISPRNVRLNTNEWATNPQAGIAVRQNKNQSYSATSLFELRTQRPVEYRQKISPMLRRVLGQDPLAVRAADVYRAFAEIPADAEIAKKVNALLERFELPMASDRDKASTELSALGVPAVIAVLRLDLNTLTPEQRARVEAFINQHDDKRVLSASEATKDMEFLVDALEYEDVRVRQAAWAALKPALNTQVAFDPAAAPEKRQAPTETLRMEVTKRLAPTTRPAEEIAPENPKAEFKAQIRVLPAVKQLDQ